MDICKWLESRVENFPLVPTKNWYEKYWRNLKEERGEKVSESSICPHERDFENQHCSPYYRSLDVFLNPLFDELNNTDDFNYTFKEMAGVNDILYQPFDVAGVERSYPCPFQDKLITHILLRSAMAGRGYSSRVIGDAMKLSDIKSNSVNISKNDISQFLKTNAIDQSFFEHMLNRIQDLYLECYERGDERNKESVIKGVSKEGLATHIQGYYITALDYFPGKCLKILSK